MRGSTTDVHCGSVWGLEIARHPPPLGRGMVGGLAACQQYLPGPHIRRQKAMCCESVAMHAVSSRCRLKSLRDERWRRPLSRRVIGERQSQREKRSRHRPGTGPQFARARFCLEILWFKSDTRNPSARRQNGRVRPFAGIKDRPYERAVSARKRSSARRRLHQLRSFELARHAEW